ncbi:GNAT family N-acetyltransferase [Clostridium paraputrificum]|uniref:GNAT family N-acetyltransferase n=1 Tax=Clostridium paraputrificum TaxID=29363 RepID=UPI0018996658|nr:GNAT family N-acetyltransferase [Clostridium paraputrificum]MDB2110483.1 GNAT family N-acetyltransferase [Clostridium paraputrificum]
MEVAEVVWGENPETQAIKELRKRIFVEEQGIGNEIIEDKDEKTCIQLIGVQQGNIIGHLRIYKISHYKYKIQRVCIDSDYRRNGFGQILIGYAEEEIKRNGGDTAILWAQQRYEAYYKKLGYSCSAFEEVINYFKKPHIEMWKKLVYK